MKELKDQILDVVKTQESLNKKIRKIEKITDGAITFGYPYTEEIMHIYRGVREIAEMLGTEVTEADSGIEEYPVRISTTVSKTRIYMLREK